MYSALKSLTVDEFHTLRSTLENEVDALESRFSKITIILDLMDRKEQLLAEISDGLTRIYTDDAVTSDIMRSSRSDDLCVIDIDNAERKYRDD